MASAKSLAGVMKWLRRQDWRDAFNEVLDRHVAPACAKADVSLDELSNLIGDHHTSVLWGSVFEDFMARDLDDGRNIVDDYLKRRGWKQSASNKAYITALRSSVMSLYEISDIVREESFLARDLVRGGEPVRVSERSGTRYLKPWDRMAARLVGVGSRIEMAGGAMPFDREASETVLKALRHGSKKARAEADKFARKPGRRVDSALIAEALSDTEVLRASAFLFTNIWLDDLLQRTLNPTLPQMCNTDGDELVFTTVSYPLKPEASADAIGLELAAIPELRPENETFWNWISLEEPTSKKQRADSQTFITTLDDGSLVLGTVELKDKMLVLEANSQQRAERGSGFYPRVPRLCCVVLDPWHVAQIIDRRKMRRGGEVRVAEPIAGQEISRPRQPADIGQMIAHIGLCRADHIGRRRAPAVVLSHEALVDALGDQRMRGFLEKLFVEPGHQPAHLDALIHPRR